VIGLLGHFYHHNSNFRVTLRSLSDTSSSHRFQNVDQQSVSAPQRRHQIAIRRDPWKYD
jgi:hypothetical protein